MSTDVVIKLQVNDAVKQSPYDNEMPSVYGIDHGIHLADDSWDPYDVPNMDVKKALRYPYKHSGMMKSVTILLPVFRDFATEEKFLIEAFNNKTTVRLAMIYAYPEGHIVKPLENMLIYDFKVVQYRLTAKIEGVWPAVLSSVFFRDQKIRGLVIAGLKRRC
jgi:hypothetical protein